MKIIIYTLTKTGEVPSYVIDGGYFPKSNGGLAPQDLDLVGIANDDAIETQLKTKEEVVEYCATFMDETVADFFGNTISVAEAVSEWCDEKGIS